MGDMMQAFILLLAGFLVVFTVLVLLIVIVTLYSKIIRLTQDAGKKRKELTHEEAVETSEPKRELRSLTRADIEEEDDEIPGEIIAVIAAAVDAVYGEKPHKIRSVKRERPARSAWSRAGAMQNTRPF